MARTYYCKNCKKTIVFQSGEDYTCKCVYMFLGKRNDTTRDPNINMRNTWSGQTQVEFSTTTIDESIKKMGGQA